jgi:uncharacterized membrane protein
MRQLVPFNKKKRHAQANYLDAFKLCIIVILLVGVVFRVVRLDHKFYAEDEVRTSLRISGYTQTEVIQQIYDHHIIPVESLDKYKFPHPETSLTDTVQVLMTHPEHPPLYYLMAHVWVKVLMRWFDHPVPVIRSLSFLISLIAFPGIYWLCLELFKSRLIAGLAVALVAISPLHIVYAQEARQYSLWTVAILLSSAALLRAIRINTKINWGVYTATLIMGLYSHLLFGLVAIAQGIYVITTQGFHLNKAVIRYFKSTLIGAIIFLPWSWAIMSYSFQLHKTMSGVEGETSLSRLIDQWFRNINRVFFDGDLGSANIIIVILVIYALYFLWRNAPKRVWLFIVALIGLPALTLMIPDLIFGGSRSTRLRYLIPSYLGIQLTFAYLFGTQMAAVSTWKQRLWRICAITIISGGVIGCVVSSPREVIWSMDDNSEYYIKIGQVINQATHPLVITDASPIQFLILSYRLEPKVWIQPLTELDRSTNFDTFSQVFIFKYSEENPDFPSQKFKPQIELAFQRQKLYLWEEIK